MAKAPKGAATRLIDLDVREVSVVDRPANKRRFLVIKRDSGLSIFRTEEHMPRSAIPREAAEEFGHIINDVKNLEDKTAAQKSETDVLSDEDFLDFIGVADEEVTDAVDATVPPAEDLITIEKGLANEALKVAKTALQKLTGIINHLKGQKEKADKLPPALANTVKVTSQVLGALAQKLGVKGGGKGGKGCNTDKAVGDVVASLTAAVERLMGVVNSLKEVDQGAETIPGQIVTQIQGVATMLTAVLERYGMPQEEMEEREKMEVTEQEKPVAPAQKTVCKPEVFMKRDGELADPELIFKAGRKMKRTRLSLFKKAVEMLQEILHEIDLETARAEASEQKKSKEEKADDDFQKRMLEKLDAIATDVGKVTKRVDEIESTRPAGHECDPPEQVEKKNRMWASVFTVNSK